MAHVWLSHAAALRRDWDRLETARREADLMPLGSGAIAGTSYPIDTEFLAQTLGFSRVTLNSIDTSGDRDFVASFLYACAMCMTRLSRLAEDDRVRGHTRQAHDCLARALSNPSRVSTRSNSGL